MKEAQLYYLLTPNHILKSTLRIVLIDNLELSKFHSLFIISNIVILLILNNSALTSHLLFFFILLNILLFSHASKKSLFSREDL